MTDCTILKTFGLGGAIQAAEQEDQSLNDLTTAVK